MLFNNAQSTWIQNTPNINSDCVGIHYLVSGKIQWEFHYFTVMMIVLKIYIYGCQRVPII